MKIKIALVLVSLFVTIEGFCILPNGSIAPNWTLAEIPYNCDPNGTWGPTWNLYEQLNAGKHAVIDFSAVWCPPCWNYHQSGVLESMWDDHGPDGDNTVRVFYIELDCSSNVECLCGSSGCSSNHGTKGNWATVDFPMFNPTGSTCYNIDNAYSISYYPTIIVVNADYKTLWEVGTASKNFLESFLFESFSLKADYEVLPSYCGSTGSVDLNVTGGYGNLSYKWSNGSKEQDLTDVATGSYSVTITDDNYYFIVLNDIEILNDEYGQIEVHENIKEVSCWGEADGEINIEVFGGSGNFDYEWSNGETTKNISGLEEGTYYLTVTDGTCTSKYSYTVKQPSKLSASAQTHNATCGQSDGEILLKGSGGKKPYRFDIGKGYSTTTRYYDLLPGTYNIGVLDKNECEYHFEIVVENIESPTANAGDDMFIDCYQKNIQLDGRESSHQGNSYSYLWTTNNGHIVSGEKTLTPTVDKAGTYKLKVTSVYYECEEYDEVVVEREGNAPIVNIAIPGVIDCNNSTVVIDASSSEYDVGYTYKWSTEDGNIINGENSLMVTVDKGGIYTLTIANPENNCVDSETIVVSQNVNLPEYSFIDKTLDCNNYSADICVDINTQYESIKWNFNDANTNCISVDEAGLYVFTIIGKNGCVVVDTVEVMGDADAPYPIIKSPDTISCKIESILIDGSGSTTGKNISYLWTTENGNILTVNTDNTITVDKAGIYTLVVTDQLTGCSNSESVEVVEETAFPDAGFEYNIDYNIITLYSDVNSEAISTWSYYDVTQSGDTVSFSVFDNGQYNICHYLENHCGIDTSCQIIEINSILPLSVNIYQNNVTCFGYNNGSINIEAEGGILEYSVNWMGPNDFTSNSFVINDLYVGKYDYEIVDSGNHKKIGSIVLTEPDEISVDINAINPTGANNDGTINLQVTGGVPPYSYLWDDNSTDKNRIGLGEGDYSFVVTDSNGCTFESSVQILATSLSDSDAFVEKFEVFPNPSLNQTNVELKFDEKIEGSLKLIDYSGKVIRIHNISFKSGMVTFDVGDLSSGVYFLKLDSKQKVEVRKFLKL